MTRDEAIFSIMEWFVNPTTSGIIHHEFQKKWMWKVKTLIFIALEGNPTRNTSNSVLHIKISTHI